MRGQRQLLREWVVSLVVLTQAGIIHYLVKLDLNEYVKFYYHDSIS